MDAPPRKRKRRVTVLRITGDPDTNLCAHVRLVLELTQAELARKLKLHATTIVALEGGRITKTQRQKLLKLLPRAHRLAWLGIPNRCKV